MEEIERYEAEFREQAAAQAQGRGSQYAPQRRSSTFTAGDSDQEEEQGIEVTRHLRNYLQFAVMYIHILCKTCSLLQ
jgi:hypothetical protein